ncbi:Uracil-DNA glycosylase, family 4 [hydrothermal vent metagenome]|uniref:Type-4 uracil-DNA glycosylase n=1 Tax=hydrothermal vent metagenome TaxID=652676 RepID=A0A1W1ECX7_9ZZZZ
MKNLKNALLLKQLHLLKILGYNYTSVNVFKEEEPNLNLPDTLEKLKKQASECYLCELSKSRSKVLFGTGDENANIMFVGDAPSLAEDEAGEPFTGRSADLLTKMIENVLNIPKSDVYITNILKCKTNNNEKPTQVQAHTCQAFLLKQIELIKPKIVVALGEVSYYYLSGNDGKLSEVRGVVHKQNGYNLIATFHPNYLLRNPSAKKDAFEDLKLIKELMN